MSKTIATPVTARTIRTAFISGALDVPEGASTDSLKPGARGTLSPVLVKAYLKANRGTVYMPGNSPLVTLPVKGRNGRPLKRQPQVPTVEARALAGAKGKRGRLSSDDLNAAAEAWVKVNRPS